MKVCLVADYIPGFHKKWSGAEIYCYRLYETLNSNNVDACILTSPFEFSHTTSEKLLPVRSIFKLDGKIARLFQPLIDPLAILDCYVKLRKIRPDIIHFHSKYLLLPVMISARLLGIKTAYTFLDYFLICHRNTFLRDDGSICSKHQGIWCAECSMQIIAGLPAKSLLRSMLKLIACYRTVLLKAILRRIDLYIALTEASKKRAIEHGIAEDKIKVNYYYVPKPIQLEDRAAVAKKYNLDPDLRYLLFVGSVSYHKGLEVLISAMRLIAVKHQQVRLLVGIGDAVPAHLAKIKKSIAVNELNEIVIFLPKMENAEVRNMINFSEIMIVPEQWPNEFGPVILVEALFYGRPVVASKIGGIGEFIVDGKNGYTFTHNDPADLAAKTSQILSDQQLYRQLLGYSKADLLKLPVFNDDLLAIYRRTIGKESTA
ncbi:MAG: glycosyltransferase family 4 protein [bacterium]|nr:glycosyltransferase family 4 protein [bacterium]MDD5756670.1 glycosyltransferase family 4 protein [bacterium]